MRVVEMRKARELKQTPRLDIAVDETGGVSLELKGDKSVV
jgi:hypothetical protein